MRNSFREMKELVQDTGDDVIFANVENTDKLQKVINGPRPYPGAASRSLHSPSQAAAIDEVAAKKKNLWRRALQGLSAKGTSDLSRIEDMLMQLLGEVDVLKTQTARPGSMGGAGQLLEQSFDKLQAEGQHEQDKALEADDDDAGGGHGSQAGHGLMAAQPRALAPPLAGDRRASDYRISTVEEKDEEYEYEQASPSGEKIKMNLLSPGRADQGPRGGSVPPETPPQQLADRDEQPLSADNTPRTDKAKKHKSSSSSGWLPKISRWSETTASSVGRVLRGSGNKKGGSGKFDEFPPPSRSGSSMASYEDNYRHDGYDDHLHTGFSDANLAPEPLARDFGPEDAKYKAHRNSLNLQHPQPRPGQMERFRTALETSAQEYKSPMTPRSTDWEGSATSLTRLAAHDGRLGGAATAAAAAGGSEAEFWQSPPGPPRPPKEPMETGEAQSPAVSGRVSRLKESSPPPQQQSSESGYGTLTATHLSNYSESSPKPEKRNLSAALGVPARRPTGPRAMTPKSPEEEAMREERRRKRGTCAGRGHGTAGAGAELTRRGADTFGTVAGGLDEADAF